MGNGRLKHQQEVRRLRCIVLVNEFLQTLDLDRVADTMTLFHKGTLRSAKQRRVFQFIADDRSFYKGRFFTFKLCRTVIKRLAVKLQSETCVFPMSQPWLKDQALRLLKLCRKAKKLPSKKMVKVNQDQAETIPMPEPEVAHNSDL